MKVGMKIRELREQRHLKLRELSRRSHISPSQISRIEHGDYFPRFDTLKRLAHGLNMPVNTLYEDIGIASKPTHQSSNSSPSKTADLADSNKTWTFEGKRVSSETMKFVRRMIKGGNK